jgi:hypothetical protein
MLRHILATMVNRVNFCLLHQFFLPAVDLGSPCSINIWRRKLGAG